MAKASGVIRHRLSQLGDDRSGAVAVITALSFATILGIAGLGTEASIWYVKKRTMQGAADSAAYSAAIAAGAGESTASAKSLANAIAAQYGYVSGTNNVTVTVNNPPASGNYTGNSSAYEVLIGQTQPLLISALFMSSGANIGSRAVASSGASGNGCVLALDRGAVFDVSDAGGAALNIANCSIYVNSSDKPGALNMAGGSVINAWSAYIVGTPNITGTGTALNTTHGTYTGTSPIADPYAGTPVPAIGSCATSPGVTLPLVTTNKTVTLNPGTYCNGLQISTGATVHLTPGTYVMDGGGAAGFKVAGSATVDCPTCTPGGAGVTIALTGTGSNDAEVAITSGANVTLNAPATGTYAGLAFFQDPSAPSTGSNSFSGGATQNITGAIYFPNQTVSFSGGATTGGAQCTQLIANEITISGGTNLNSNCTNDGTKSIGSSQTALVE
jgi:Flp pilus assembly protein TadG